MNYEELCQTFFNEKDLSRKLCKTVFLCLLIADEKTDTERSTNMQEKLLNEIGEI